MNMMQSINNALDIALESDKSAVVFGEDIAFGGVFRCTMGLQVDHKALKHPTKHTNHNKTFNSRTNTAKSEFSTRHYASRASPDSASASPRSEQRPSPKFSSPIIYFPRSIRSVNWPFLTRKNVPFDVSEIRLQLVNEAAKYRYRSGGTWDCGALTVRAPCGAVGHGAVYHSQSPEAYFSHTPGLKVLQCCLRGFRLYIEIVNF